MAAIFTACFSTRGECTRTTSWSLRIHRPVCCVMSRVRSSGAVFMDTTSSSSTMTTPCTPATSTPSKKCSQRNLPFSTGIHCGFHMRSGLTIVLCVLAAACTHLKHFIKPSFYVVLSSLCDKLVLCVLAAACTHLKHFLHLLFTSFCLVYVTNWSCVC
jgi:hypothetical protein